MKEQLYINIPTPCHENWDKMTPGTEGRFCGSCAKTVVDFSVMTDNDVLNYFNKNKGNLCGRFAEDQLQRPLIETQLQPKKGWKYWLASVASLFVLMGRGAAQAKVYVKKGEVAVAGKTECKTIKGDTVLEPLQPVILGQLTGTRTVLDEKITTIAGIVTDENKRPLAGASVMIKSLEKVAVTDANGKFVFKGINTDAKLKLTVSFVGYTTRVVEANTITGSKTVIQLAENKAAMGEVIVVGGIRPYTKIKKADTLKTALSKLLKNESFTVYPNPVTKNTMLQVVVKVAGDYEVQLLNGQSQLLYSRHNILLKAETVAIPVPANALPGQYYVRLINNKTKKQLVEKVIVQ